MSQKLKPDPITRKRRPFTSLISLTPIGGALAHASPPSGPANDSTYFVDTRFAATGPGCGLQSID